MPPKFDPRDKSRTSGGKTHSLVAKHTAPPRDQGGWMAITREFLESPAYRTLSVNGRKALDRLIIEHIAHGRLENGRLIVTHDQFYTYGVTAENTADALDELEFKRLIIMDKGRAGNGTPYATTYTLTFDGTHEGAAASNGWRAVTMEDAKRWSETVRKQRAEARAAASTKKSPLRNSEVAPLRKPVVPKLSQAG
ncbi:hypothetical protein [Shinella sp. DD12]|uniref:hypothetical protein n=1 Tax=Shinella sp. DD12 TaxID=1410620 RepID=UPI00043792AB|nr:hypothetical protein [Shinella sp. DD12]EYR84253.1 hypothetical protein SHLA_14c000350 [Shinella sp. DD12]